MVKKRLSQRHPIFYFLAVWTNRLKRYLSWHCGRKAYAKAMNTGKLPYRVKKHQSVLLKKLGDTDMQLQYNKIKNLEIAIEKINGIIIKPGETFSFHKLVGLPSRRKGYLPGMLLSCGEARVGTGGGLCQLSNLLHWLVMHSPLTIVERYHHSFGPLSR